MTKAGDIYKALKRSFPKPEEGSLRVWWIPQLGGDGFDMRVPDLTHAAVLLDALAAYDDFLFANNIRGDHANAGGLEMYENGEWVSWENDDYLDFDEYLEAHREPPAPPEAK